MKSVSLARFALIGRIFYAAALVFFGVQHLIYGEFITRLLPTWPWWIPGRAFCPYAAGLALVIAGMALCVNRLAFRAALWGGSLFLLSALLLALPPAIAHPNLGIEWTNAGKAFALGSGAFVLAFALPGHLGLPSSGIPVLIGRLCLSGFLIICGIQHFLWAQFVVQLVPAWIPWPWFWAYFAGVALIAGGLGLLLRPTARLAAWLVALMVFLWLIMLHIPRSLASPHDANEATAVFEAMAISGIALLLAIVFESERKAGDERS